MPILSELQLVNGSTGDAALYLDFPGADNAVLFDAGENGRLTAAQIKDLRVLLLSHHHPDHSVGLARVVRYLADTDKQVDVFGPPGTIDRVEQQLRAVQWMRFPFMKLRLRVSDIAPGAPRTSASFECQEGFTREDLPPSRRRSSLLLETDEFRLRCASASHTVPCLAYAIEIKRGYVYDRVKAADRPLRPGRWTSEVRRAMARPVASRPRTIDVDGARFPLAELVARYFSREPANRIAYITDTRVDDATYDGLVAIARGARRLYCDAYYRNAQHEAATKHGHLTAGQAAQLAADADVGQLWLMHLGARYRGKYDALVDEARAVFPDTYAELVE